MNADQKMVAGHAKGRIRFLLSGRSIVLDRRMNAVRGDLADINLAGVLFAPHYAKAQPMHCEATSAYLHESGSADAVAVSQLLAGETFHVLDVTGAWAWGFCDHDGYVGYIKRGALSSAPFTATHRVLARCAPIFAAADIKAPVVDLLSAGALISGEVEGSFVITNKGAIHIRHVAEAGTFRNDWVAAAERNVGQPYIWGGRGHGGIDCSGLVQVALGQAGIRVPRDTDLQRDGIGVPLEQDAELQRGDLIFFPGHVGIMADARNLLHANAYWMSTLVEPLADVVARIAQEHGEPVSARRRIDL